MATWSLILDIFPHFFFFWKDSRPLAAVCEVKTVQFPWLLEKRLANTQQRQSLPIVYVISCCCSCFSFKWLEINSKHIIKYPRPCSLISRPCEFHLAMLQPISNVKCHHQFVMQPINWQNFKLSIYNVYLTIKNTVAMIN